MPNVGILIPLKSTTDRRNAIAKRAWVGEPVNGTGRVARYSWPNHAPNGSGASGVPVGSWSRDAATPGTQTNYPGAPDHYEWGPVFAPDRQLAAVAGTIWSMTAPDAASPAKWSNTGGCVPSSLDWAQGYLQGRAAYSDDTRSGMDAIAQSLVLAHPLSVLAWIVVEVVDHPDDLRRNPVGRNFFRTGTVKTEDTYANCCAYIDANY